VKGGFLAIFQLVKMKKKEQAQVSALFSLPKIAPAVYWSRRMNQKNRVLRGSVAKFGLKYSRDVCDKICWIFLECVFAADNGIYGEDRRLAGLSAELEG
jgi:hypothetical protein